MTPEWEARAESMTCEYEQSTGDDKRPVLCLKDNAYATAKECNACKGIDAPKRDRSAGRASKAKKLSYYEYALEMRDWARIHKERADKATWMLREAIEDGPGYSPTNALELRWQDHNNQRRA